MNRTTTDTTTATDEALVAMAAKGGEDAFQELHRRHAPLAWRLALAVTGDADLAARAVADATGTVFTAVRAGRPPSLDPGAALAAAARNAGLDLRQGGVPTSPVVADDADAHLAAAFATLPERWRSVLWLRDAEGLDAEQVAPLVELDPDAVDQLAVRARRGLRERYLKAEVGAGGPRTCSRAVARLGALEDGTLDARDTANLQRHLRLCPQCTDRRERIATLGTAVPTLALPMPGDLRDEAAKAWTAALASSTHTGLAPRTEKILAGASAFAAVLGIVGAAFIGRGDGTEPVASPLAPLVADIEAPRPVDLSALTLPLTTPDPITSTARRSLSPVASAAGDATEQAATGDAGVGASPTPRDPETSSDPGPIASEQPTGPIAVDPEDGLTVGPINLDTSPGEDEPALEIELPDELDALDPVVDPVTEAVNTVTSPVLEAVEPVTTPLLEAVEPVTDAVEDVAEQLTGPLRGLGSR